MQLIHVKLVTWKDCLAHEKKNSFSLAIQDYYLIKGCVCYIFAILFFMSKWEHLRKKEECSLFHLESSFPSWDNQILNFRIFKCHDVVKCQSMKHETHFTE